MKQLLIPLALTALLGLAQCHKSDPDPATPESQLPPATQTGANTFGCLVNGEVLLPKGNVGVSNLSLTYDPNWRGGDFNLSVYNKEGGRLRDFTLDASPFTKAGIYSFLRPNGICTGLYSDVSGSAPTSANACSVIGSDQDVIYRSGTLEVTRFDTQAHIASGTFACKLLIKGCTDTIKVTQGRFDVKF